MKGPHPRDDIVSLCLEVGYAVVLPARSGHSDKCLTQHIVIRFSSQDRPSPPPVKLGFHWAFRLVSISGWGMPTTFACTAQQVPECTLVYNACTLVSFRSTII